VENETTSQRGGVEFGMAESDERAYAQLSSAFPLTATPATGPTRFAAQPFFSGNGAMLAVMSC
jgi:hypothetical protein